MPSWSVHFDLTLRVALPGIIQDLARVHALAGVIRGIPIPPSVQRRLDRLNILRAARGTIGIEGTELSQEEIERVADSPPDLHVLGTGREREEREARNAETLMRYIREHVEANPDAHLSEHQIRSFHRIVTEGIDYPRNIPGGYRSHALNAGAYRPPDTGGEVRRLMADFVQWFHTGVAESWDPVVRAIVAHFFVVSIHPFGDGNGRTSRAVESFLLYKAGVNVRGFFSLANYYYLNRQEYVDQLNLVQLRGSTDLTPFVAFALRGLVQELEAVHAEVLAEVRVISFRDYARETLASNGRLGTPAGERQLRLLTEMGSISVSLKELRSGRHPLSRLYRNVSARTLARDVSWLKEQQLIEAVGDELRARVDLMTRFTA